jgi:hypothetical protein
MVTCLLCDSDTRVIRPERSTVHARDSSNPNLVPDVDTTVLPYVRVRA